MSRPSIELVLMSVAVDMSLRGTCPRRQVGAIIASKRGNILASAYNGAPSGMPHCPPLAEHQESCTNAIHAEANAIYDAANRGVSTAGATMHVTLQPCVKCAQAIIQAGIDTVYFLEEYDPDGTILLVRAGVSVYKASGATGHATP